MNDLSLKEIQKASFDVLKQFDKICRDNNFSYTLAYGTLIGAIRHNGFIPWDDDVDVWMPRNDYDKFVQYCIENDKLIKPFKICTRYTVNNYSYGISRFSNQNFKYVNTNKLIKNIDIGIFLDIYPIDNYCNNYQDASKLLKKINNENRKYEIYINSKTKSPIKCLMKKIINVFLNILYGNDYNRIMEKKIKDILNRYTTSKDRYVGCVVWSDTLILHERKDVFNEDNKFQVIEHKFEDNSFFILKNYDKILRNSYGDYMKLPPEKERHPYHEYKIEKR